MSVCVCVCMHSAGDALRATLGMTLGYVSRPFFKMEALLYPIYNSVLKLVLPDALFEVRKAEQEAKAVFEESLVVRKAQAGTAGWSV